MTNSILFRELKSQYNRLTKTIWEETEALKVDQWHKFCNSISDERKFSGEYWKKIKQIGSQSSAPKKHKKIPSLLDEGCLVNTNSGKAAVFGKVLKSIFSEEHDNEFDMEHFNMVEEYIGTNKETLFTTNIGNEEYDQEFKEEDVKEVLKKLKRKSAPGIDGINNKHIINLPETGLKIITAIANLSWNNHNVLEEWKIAQITMIGKKAEDIHNPSNYRPISLTNTKIKLIEKLIKVMAAF